MIKRPRGNCYRPRSEIVTGSPPRVQRIELDYPDTLLLESLPVVVVRNTKDT